MNQKGIVIRKPFGDFMRAQREAANLSQTEVAEILGCKPQFVSNWERGMSCPPLGMQRVFAKICRVSSEEMLSQNMQMEERRLISGLKIKQT